MTTQYVADDAGMRALLVGPEMHELVAKCAGYAKEFAVAIAPDREPYGEGYIASFDIHAGLVQDLTVRRRTLRASADVVNSARYATAVELGWTTGKGRQTTHRGYHVLSQTAAAIGDPFPGDDL